MDKSVNTHQGQPRIVDPARQLLEREQASLTDFAFRLTGDPSRAAVVAREASLQLSDELRSGLSLEDLRVLYFQRAFELSEESLQPVSRVYLEEYYRLQHRDPQSAARLYRWELFLLELGQHAAVLLLLQFRFGFRLEHCCSILDRDGLEEESAALLALIARRGALDIADLKDLPRYGFLGETYAPQTALSRVMRHLQVPQNRKTVALSAALILLASIAIGYWLGLYVWVRP